MGEQDNDTDINSEIQSRALTIMQLTALTASTAAVAKAQADRAAIWTELGLDLTKNYRLDGNTLVEM